MASHKNRVRFRQSDLESQDKAGSRYQSHIRLLPVDYPRANQLPQKKRLPRYQAWRNILPPNYPIAGGGPVAYQPLKHADLRVIKEVEYARETPGFKRPKPYTLSTFDARPINAVDFVDTFTAADLTADLFTGTYTVPAGRTAIFRRLSLRAYMSDAALARSAVTGAPLAALTMSFLIDGNAVDQVNNIRVDDAVCTPTFQSPLEIPLYFLAPALSVVTLSIANATGGIDFAAVCPVITGNLLLSEGVNPTSEPGTQNWLPVAAHVVRGK